MPPEIDNLITAIRVGQLLGIPATVVRSGVGVHWVAAALIMMEAEVLAAEQGRKK